MTKQTLARLLEQQPYAADFFKQNKLDISGFEQLTPAEYLAHFSPEELEDRALEPERLLADLALYLEQMRDFLGLDEQQPLRTLTILPGRDKAGQAEDFERLTLHTSEIVSIVGPTGSGKSRLLADIEWAAQGDTPTGRRILINDAPPDPQWRYSSRHKLVAQLSQNMNFVMDLTVQGFLQLHAESRLHPDPAAVTREIMTAANRLAGEAFALDTPVTSLSGGQSRALMIADTAILSASPIVLIDEIENAGIDRKRALELLVAQDKIVLMATHDPLLALMANRRLVINNGGICQVLTTSPAEKAKLGQLQQLDAVIAAARQQLRRGQRLS
ncbi:ATP-binding cassette domain-containing protein [Oscillospiraceae bacterium HV4-5-C5C]|nr:ATP-binding cassette domain-containing protein [Oscillospiraceae bacterium HV4-5-C5C]